MTVWYKNTTANFRPLDAAIATALVEFAGRRSNIGKTIDLGGQTYTLDFISHATSAFWRSRGLSIYYRVNRSIVRISDHWSRSHGHDRSRKMNCGRIGSSCFWAIDNAEDAAVSCYAHGCGRHPYQMLAGICAVRGFVHHA